MRPLARSAPCGAAAALPLSRSRRRAPGSALIWKIVLVVELLGRSNGVGFEIQVYFQLFDVTGILAYALAFIVVVQLIEWGCAAAARTAGARWRR